MEKRKHTNTCSDIISQIQAAVSGGQLNEAYDLILSLESKDTPPLGPIDEMKVTMLKGLVLLKREEYKAAEECLLRSLELANTFGDTRLRYNRYDNLVALYITTNQVHQAIVYLKKSMELKESVGNEGAYARSLLQMAMVLISIEDYNDARDALDKANEIISHLGDREMEMHYHFAMALLSVKEGNHAEALSQYDQIIKYTEEVNDIFLASRAYLNQGDILTELGRWDDAKNIYGKLLQLTQDNHLIASELLTSVRLAKIALKQNDIKRCRSLYDYINSHMGQAEEDDQLQESLAEVGAELFEAEGDHHEALNSFRTYLQNYKKHYDNEQSKVILYIKARYETEKKERELQAIKLSQMESEMKTLIAEKTLRDTEKRFRSWIENGTEMIFILNEDMKPTYVSPYIFKTFGYTKEDFKTQKVRDLIHQEDTANILDALNESRSHHGVAVNTNFRFPQKDGHYRWLECTMTNLLNDETVQGIVCNLKDITERKQSEEAIQDLNRSLEIKVVERTSELKEAIKDLEAFCYSVSHDLRAPLRIITGYAKLLISDHEHLLSDEAKEFANLIFDNSKLMSQLIDDLLNFSRMGRKAVYRTTVDINKMVTTLISEMRKTDNTITKDITIHELPSADCDLALIKQVWVNLISNAVKYSSKKPNPIIEIGSEVKNNETVYYIKDNGAGFDMRFAQNLFTVFQRLHDKSDFEGTGVGLALAHRIIKMHEGNMWVEASIDKGATFYFTIGKQVTHEDQIV